jgi:hypothetical protein
MTDTDAARNFGARPGYALNDSVELEGWDGRSVWGYDEGVASFYAQLWTNASGNDAPDIWLSGVDPRYPWPGCLALAVVEATGRDPVTVIAALGLATPDATVRPAAHVTRRMQGLGDPAGDSYAAGAIAVYRWALLGCGAAPGSWRPWNGEAPTPQHVDAEHHMITGRVYQQHDAATHAWIAGADEALAWLLSNERR